MLQLMNRDAFFCRNETKQKKKRKVCRHLSAVEEELVQLVRGGEHLRPSLHQLQQVGPGFVHPVLPLSDGGCLRVAVVDQLVHHLVDGGHALLPHAARLRCKFGELLLQDLNNPGGCPTDRSKKLQ